MGHLAVTQQLLCIGLAGGTLTLDREWVDKFRKGSIGSSVITEKEYEQLKDTFLPLVDITEDMYTGLKNNPFKVYTTSYNITLNSLDDTLQFVNTHEGLHFGVMMTLRKFV